MGETTEDPALGLLAGVRVVLVGTLHSGNIGSAARAMKNMGLRRLYLAAPAEFPHREATYRAVQATDWSAGAAALGGIRLWVGVNLAIGVAIIASTVLMA